MRLIGILAVLLTVVAGCATSSRVMNRIGLGMTKAEVIAVLGDPKSVSAQSGREYFLYTFYEDGKIGLPREHFVRFQAGKVESYGRVGDFDSTKPAESTININVKNQGQSQ